MSDPQNRWYGPNTTSQRPPITRNDLRVVEDAQEVMKPTRSEVEAEAERERQVVQNHQQVAAQAAGDAAAVPVNVAEALAQHGVPVAAARALGNYVAVLERRIQTLEEKLR
jgi:hypothetical protein